jgi:hypothetical protein
MSRLSQVPAGGPAKTIGFTWSADATALAATPAGAALHTVVGGTPVQFNWDAGTSRYLRYIGGVAQHAADGAPIATPNVIVQFCNGHVNPHDIDVAGNPGYFTESIGTGRVAVYRDGHVVNGTWSRATADAGTTLTDAAGQPIALAPGGAWVVLVATGAPLS